MIVPHVRHPSELKFSDGASAAGEQRPVQDTDAPDSSLTPSLRQETVGSGDARSVAIRNTLAVIVGQTTRWLESTPSTRLYARILDGRPAAV